MRLLCILFFCFTIIFAYKTNETAFGIGGYSYFPIICIGFGLLRILEVSLKRQELKIRNILPLSLVFIVAIQILVFNVHFTSGVVLSYVIFFVLCWLLGSEESTWNEIQCVANSYVLSGVIFACLLFSQMRIASNSDIRFSVFYSDDKFYDLNFLASSLYCSFSIGMFMISKYHSKVIKCIYMSAILFIVAALLLTGSRAAFIAIGISFVPYINRKQLVSLIIIGGVLYAVLPYLLPELLVQRFMGDSYNDASNEHRLENWKNAILGISMHPLTGCGLDYSIEALERVIHKTVNAHNTYLYAIMHFGILFSILFFVFMLRPIVKIMKFGLSKKLVWIILGYLFTTTIIEATLSLTFITNIAFYYLLSRSDVTATNKLFQ